MGGSVYKICVKYTNASENLGTHGKGGSYLMLIVGNVTVLKLKTRSEARATFAEAMYGFMTVILSFKELKSKILCTRICQS